eukprot:2280535-Lingulodinium_polyedra.AAC.1
MRAPGDRPLIDSPKPAATTLKSFCMLVVDKSGHTIGQLSVCPVLSGSRFSGSCKSTVGARTRILLARASTSGLSTHG